MSDSPRGPGWWMDNDGLWHPPEQHQLKIHRTPSPAGLRRVDILCAVIAVSTVLLLIIVDLLWR